MRGLARMRQISCLPLVSLALAAPVWASGAPASSSVRATGAVAAATTAALQADAPRALEALRSVPAAEFRGTEARLRACLMDRLGGTEPRSDGVAGTAPHDPFARAVLAAFRSYWARALANPAARPAEEERLRASLRALVGAGAADTLDGLEPQVTARLRSAGYRALMGVTSPLRELMLWSAEETQRREVALPEGRVTVRIVILDRFESLGWAEWATCGRHATGGWADEHALYAVRPRYRTLGDETFRVTFLAHEAQHRADRRRYPGLSDWELEYRAKLTQLALAEDTREATLAGFSRNQGDDRAVPHAFADREVLAALRARLGLPAGADLARVDGRRLRTAAAEILRDDTISRSSKPR